MTMKKMMIAFAAAMAVFASARAEFHWSWWTGGDTASKSVKGCVLGLGSEVKDIRGAEVSLCLNKAVEVKGGAQVAIGYNCTETLRNGCQVAFVNRAEKSALQLGLLCFNKSGFVPVFVFFNFDPKMFGSGN
jgi:hypothetical protein